MFTKLLSWLRGFSDWLGGTFHAVWQVVSGSYAWIIATIIGFLAITDTVSNFVVQCVSDAGTFFGILSVGGGSTIAQWANYLLGVINIFFPLTEGFTLLSAYSLVLFAAWTYRAIKSWIPTLS
jgi:hypothetical protein